MFARIAHPSLLAVSGVFLIGAALICNVASAEPHRSERTSVRRSALKRIQHAWNKRWAERDERQGRNEERLADRFPRASAVLARRAATHLERAAERFARVGETSRAWQAFEAARAQRLRAYDAAGRTSIEDAVAASHAIVRAANARPDWNAEAYEALGHAWSHATEILEEADARGDASGHARIASTYEVLAETILSSRDAAPVYPHERSPERAAEEQNLLARRAGAMSLAAAGDSWSRAGEHERARIAYRGAAALIDEVRSILVARVNEVHPVRSALAQDMLARGAHAEARAAELR